jgi:uncharacterized repeat protein (TIGR01451 family)
MTPRFLSTALLVMIFAGHARAQVMAPPARGPAPLLYVRVSGPAGMRVTFFQGRAVPRSFPAPVVVGMRPGYVYRLRLDNIPGRPGVSLYPTLEVRGTLTLPPKLVACKFPAPVAFTEVDLAAAFSNKLVTKLIYLEHPDKAEPVSTQPGEALETDLAVNRDLVAEAKLRGRPVVILRLGDGVPESEDLQCQTVAGTVLLPGERALGWPAIPPCIPWSPWQFHDPYLGPNSEDECFHDGGDRDTPAAIGPNGQLVGLDPEDTVAEFTDSCGRRSVTHSNRVCLCVPRFAALRTELPLSHYDSVAGPSGTRSILVQNQIERRQPPELTRGAEGLNAFRGRLRPSENVNVKGPGLFTQVQLLQAHEIMLGPAELLATPGVQKLTAVQRLQLAKQVEFAAQFSGAVKTAGTEQVIGTAVVGIVEGGSRVVSAIAATRDYTVCCNEAPVAPDKPLVLVKCADRSCAQVGDIVTFTLKYSNGGGRAILDVAVSDSLSGRLEYIPNSAESDRDAVFTMQENEAGSLILRWEIAGKLLPGDSGRLKFKARIR